MRSLDGVGRFRGQQGELEETGKNVNPHSIPDSLHWALTNKAASKNQDILRGVLSVLTYGDIAIQKAGNAL